MITFTFLFMTTLFVGVGYICIPEFIKFIEDVVKGLS